MIQNSPERTLAGTAATLRALAGRERDDDFAASQLRAAADLLEQLAPRVEWRRDQHGALAARARSVLAAVLAEAGGQGGQGGGGGGGDGGAGAGGGRSPDAPLAAIASYLAANAGGGGQSGKARLGDDGDGDRALQGAIAEAAQWVAARGTEDDLAGQLRALLGWQLDLERRVAREAAQRHLGTIGLRQVDHVGIAVRDLGAAVALFCDVFGGRFMVGGDEDEMGIRTVQLDVPPGIRLELMQPLHQGSYLQRFIDKHGEGFHHMTVFVEDVARAAAALEAAGYEVVDTEILRSIWYQTYLRPKHGFGTLLQLVQTDRDWSEPWGAFDLDDVMAGRVVWRQRRPWMRDDPNVPEPDPALHQ